VWQNPNPHGKGKQHMSDAVRSDGDERDPRGTLSMRTICMPSDTNQYGDIFGGWLLAQMNIAGGIFAADTAQGRTATIAVDAMTFKKPVNVGDVMCVYTDQIRIGTTSIAVHVEAWMIRRNQTARLLVTEGNFMYLALATITNPVASKRIAARDVDRRFFPAKLPTPRRPAQRRGLRAASRAALPSLGRCTCGPKWPLASKTRRPLRRWGGGLPMGRRSKVGTAKVKIDHGGDGPMRHAIVILQVKVWDARQGRDATR
jgi:acyl-CoA thioesterase YciA